MHVQDQLREVILRRIEKGTLNVKLLSGLACVSPAHVSNFIRGHRDLSAAMFEKIMRAVGFEAEIFPASAYLPQAKADALRARPPIGGR